MLLYLNGIFVGLLILSNIVAVKLFSIGTWAMLPAAVIIYIFTFPLTDVIVEVYGKKEAQRTVRAGLITQLMALIFIAVTIALPAAPTFTEQTSYETILSGSFRVVLASLISYTISQHLDVYVFGRLKAKHGAKKLWLRNNASTMLSQLIDTTIFITIAFYGMMPLSVLGGLIITQYAFKFLATIVLTPVVYLLVSLVKKQEAKQKVTEATAA
ncbi:queuosine precursor transporter [Mesobacillus maritimus]|uniref:queuosine precursor transporter n=1 Tax=Mesobacillus maritimus TaxID=1643336 RepID=UPI0020419CE7|nr:queuosine precursor transporter [Mesobacillus maritimus]MCM3668180.1 queuosine precursor transporter [Mesobacillus maritimus]